MIKKRISKRPAREITPRKTKKMSIGGMRQLKTSVKVVMIARMKMEKKFSWRKPKNITQLVKMNRQANMKFTVLLNYRCGTLTSVTRRSVQECI